MENKQNANVPTTTATPLTNNNNCKSSATTTTTDESSRESHKKHPPSTQPRGGGGGRGRGRGRGAGRHLHAPRKARTGRASVGDNSQDETGDSTSTAPNSHEGTASKNGKTDQSEPPHHSTDADASHPKKNQAARAKRGGRGRGRGGRGRGGPRKDRDVDTSTTVSDPAADNQTEKDGPNLAGTIANAVTHTQGIENQDTTESASTATKQETTNENHAQDTVNSTAPLSLPSPEQAMDSSGKKSARRTKKKGGIVILQKHHGHSVFSSSNGEAESLNKDTVQDEGVMLVETAPVDMKDDITEEKKQTNAVAMKKKKKNPMSEKKAAAKRFNESVRLCVERRDPQSMRDILRDRHNHKFALNATVLETVMKAYVVAAMFQDALYCLKHNVLPETLSTIQTERILSCLPQNLRNSSAYMAADMIDALCTATKFENSNSRSYFLRVVRGIALEFLEEVTSARDRICSAHCERLVRASVCVVDAKLSKGKKPTELVVTPGDQLGIFVPDSADNRGIQAGDAVSILPYAGPYPLSPESLDRDMIEATVINMSPMVLRLQDKPSTDLLSFFTEDLPGNKYRIDKLANRMGYNRQLAAAIAIASPLPEDEFRDPRRPCPQLIKAITAMDENIQRVMTSRGALPRGETTTTASFCAEAVPWNVADESDDIDREALRATSRLALERYGALENLNPSQKLAVEGAVTNRLTLVQGPPGTGKTMVAIRILRHWALLTADAVARGEDPPPILATSDSNIAVDNLVEGCAKVGLRVVRLGRPEAVRPELLPYCIDRPPSSYDKNNGGKAQAQNSAKERTRLLKSAQVICCTCIGSGGDILDGIVFERILLDEATQATEAAVLVPIMRGCRQLVLVGDHCQLPPTVLSTKAEEEGHGVPLFSRMVACGVPPFMLDTQYRMNPCIAQFPSDLFYGGMLKNGVSAPERRPLQGFPWPREEFPVAFLPVKGVEMDDGVSKYNEEEALAACDAVSMLLEGGQCTISDIAVVTPYAAQARVIRRLVRKLTPSNGPPYIEVSSVDGFQGREKEAVVFSAVRSNDYGSIGFTSDWRRVNVSFTRARRALIVIGNDTTLRRGDPETWSPWLAWADACGINMERPGIPRGRYDPEQLRRVRGGTTAAEMLKDVLERQQAQHADAERRQERAQMQTHSHIRDEEEKTETEKQQAAISLEEDLARMQNEEGNWDDSDHEEKMEMHHSASRATLASSVATATDVASGSSDAVDIWDL